MKFCNRSRYKAGVVELYLVRHKMLIQTPILLQWTYSNQACFSVKSQHLLHKFCPLSANLRLFLFLKTIFWPEAVVAALWHSYTTISARTWISTRCIAQITLTKIGCKLRKRITISRQRKYIYPPSTLRIYFMDFLPIAVCAKIEWPHSISRVQLQLRWRSVCSCNFRSREHMHDRK